ncbi:MAG TPA: cytochrome P460 family protein [Terracidiphilus sp.]|nr:cytochrome P460 family protein [Terracidiphilus sp.]
MNHAPEQGKSGKKFWLVALLAVLVVLAAIQFVHPAIPFGPSTAEIAAPPAVRQVLAKDCFSCHSNENRLAWFDQAEPAYWLVRRDVLQARAHLNFSTIGSRPLPAQKAALYEAVAMMQMGAMPLPSFVKLHPEARVTPEDLAAIKAYLNPWSTPLPKMENVDAAISSAPRINLAAVQPTANGLAFDPTLEGWRLIATTNRGDNMQFRLILGNPAAVQAAREGKVHPWPDGARFAKFAWLQTQGDDGLVYPGAFWQVELMVKNAEQYRLTDGWSWGRWRGLALKPYGKNAAVGHECTGCHMPVRGNDAVYTEPISTAIVPGNEVLNANAARLPVSLPFQPLGWGVVSMFLDPQRHTSSVLFANDAGLEAARAHSDGAMQYPAGSVLALVTWTERDDPHWFGARIPDQPVSVEFVEVSTGGQIGRYRRFAGAALHETSSASAEALARVKFIEGLRPLQLP